jgi:hypothetical protein
LSLANWKLRSVYRKKGCQGGIKLYESKIFFPDDPPHYRSKEWSPEKLEFLIPEVWGRSGSPRGESPTVRKFPTLREFFRKNYSDSVFGKNGLDLLFDCNGENFEIENPDTQREKYFEKQRSPIAQVLLPKSRDKKDKSGKKVSWEQVQLGRALNIRLNLRKGWKNSLAELRSSHKCIGGGLQRELVPGCINVEHLVSYLKEPLKGKTVPLQGSFFVKSRRRWKTIQLSGFYHPFLERKIKKNLKGGKIFMTPSGCRVLIKAPITNNRNWLWGQKKTQKTTKFRNFPK